MHHQKIDNQTTNFTPQIKFIKSIWKCMGINYLRKIFFINTNIYQKAEPKFHQHY